MADVSVSLSWAAEGLRFQGGARGGPVVTIDGSGRAGPSPMAMLLLSLGGCSAADVVDILGKMRVPLAALEVGVDGDRAPSAPRRYTRIRMEYRARGVPPADEDKLRRAVALSHEKYCSVVHTLRPDVEITVDVHLD